MPSRTALSPRRLQSMLKRLALGAGLVTLAAIAQPPWGDSRMPAQASVAADTQIYLPIVGNHWPVGLHEVSQVGGTLGQVVIADRNAFVGEGRRVNVYAIDGAGPVRQVGSSPVLAADVKDLTPYGRFLFVRVGGTLRTGGTYEVFDIGEGAVMEPLRSAGLAAALDGANDVTFHGDSGYICDGSGLRVMDARDPLHMVELGALQLTDGLTDCQRSDSGVLMARCVRKCGNEASLASDSFLWRAIDVRDPSTMRIIRSIGDDDIPDRYWPTGNRVDGNRLYMESASFNNIPPLPIYTLILNDVSDPLDWHSQGMLSLPFYETCSEFGAAEGTRIYAGGRSTCVYDWSHTGAAIPRLAATLTTPPMDPTLGAPPANMAARGDRLAVIGRDLSAFDVGDVDAPRALGSVGVIGEPVRVAGRGPTLVTLSFRRVSHVDVSRHAAPRVVATWDAAPRYGRYGGSLQPSFDHALSLHRLPVYDGQDLIVLDLDHPSSPLRSTSIRLFDMAAPGVVVSQDRLAVVASEGSRLRAGDAGERVPGAIIVIQHDIPEGPRVIGRIDLTQVQSLNPQIHFTSGRIIGQRAYFTTNDPPTLAIVDLAQPSAPMVLNWVPLMGDLTGVTVGNRKSYAVAVRDGVAYVAAGAAGLRIVPVAVPSDASEVAVIAAGKAVDVIDATAPGGGAVLHVADADGALRVFDLGDPLAPLQIDVLPVNGQPASVTVGNDGSSDVWVAAQSGGVVGFAWR